MLLIIIVYRQDLINRPYGIIAHISGRHTVQDRLKVNTSHNALLSCISKSTPARSGSGAAAQTNEIHLFCKYDQHREYNIHNGKDLNGIIFPEEVPEHDIAHSGFVLQELKILVSGSHHKIRT